MLISSHARLQFDSNNSLTFFALPNHAFPKPPHRRNSTLLHALDSDNLDAWKLSMFSLPDLAADLAALEDMDPPDDKRREFIKKLVTAVLKYNLLPGSLDRVDLGKNTTYPTLLSGVFGALDNQPLRLRVSKKGPFALAVNIFSTIIGRDIPATNGKCFVAFF